MTTRDIAAALQRVEAVLQRRPETGIHDDAPATATLEGGTRVTARHGNGTALCTDMPREFGGSGEQVTPGWLFRASLASCATTSIVFAAAAEGIEFTALEVKAESRSDARGLLGMADAAGEPVPATPLEVRLQVRAAAPGVAPERLRAVVERGLGRSPVPGLLPQALPLGIEIEIDAEVA